MGAVERVAVEAFIFDLLEKEFEKSRESLSVTTRFREDLNFDSLDAFDFFTALSEAYGLSLDEKQIVNVQTIGDVVELVLASAQG